MEVYIISITRLPKINGFAWPSSSSYLYIWNQGSSYLIYWQLGAWSHLVPSLKLTANFLLKKRPKLTPKGKDSLRIRLYVLRIRDGLPTFLFFSDGIGTQKILFDQEGSGFLGIGLPNSQLAHFSGLKNAALAVSFKIRGGTDTVGNWLVM